MTKTLVIDCSLSKSAKNSELLGALKRFSECVIVPFRAIHADYQIEMDTDAVVLSGSAARIVKPSHRDMFKATTDLINCLDLPILGICYGHQLLCWSLGCSVASLAKPVIDRFEEVCVLEVDEIFAGFEERKTILLAQSHYDYVERDSLDPANLILLANSQSCEVEAVRHKCSAFYGVQFHPERIKLKDRTCLEGHKIIENFYKNVVKR
jgi:GMP synthase-like glutamine amidotransferase